MCKNALCPLFVEIGVCSHKLLVLALPLLSDYVPLSPGHSKQSATEAWHQFTELSLIAFTRHYFKAVATIAEKVETEIFGEDASLKGSTLKAVIDCLHV